MGKACWWQHHTTLHGSATGGRLFHTNSLRTTPTLNPTAPNSIGLPYQTAYRYPPSCTPIHPSVADFFVYTITFDRWTGFEQILRAGILQNVYDEQINLFFKGKHTFHHNDLTQPCINFRCEAYILRILSIYPWKHKECVLRSLLNKDIPPLRNNIFFS